MSLIPPHNRGRRTPASRLARQRLEACESRSLLCASPAAVVVGEFADAGTVSEELISTEVLTETQDIDFEALITECWEVNPPSLVGIDEGLGCGPAEGFEFTDESTEASGELTDPDGEVSIYELEDFDPAWAIRGGFVYNEYPVDAPVDESFVMYPFDPLPAGELELLDPVWCDFSGMEGVDDGLGCGMAEGEILEVKSSATDESSDTDTEIITYELEGFDPSWAYRGGAVVDDTEHSGDTDTTDDTVYTDEAIIDDSFVMYPFDPVATGDLELTEPVWCDFGGLDGLGVPEDGIIDDSFVMYPFDPVATGDLEVIDPVWCDLTGLGGSEDGVIDDSFVMYPFDPVAPGDLEVFEPVWCDFGGMEGWEDGLGCGISLDGYLPPGELIDEILSDEFTNIEEEVVQIRNLLSGDVSDESTEDAESPSAVGSDEEIVIDDSFVLYAFDPLPLGEDELIDPVWCDPGGMEGWEDGLGCGVSLDGYLPPGELIDEELSDESTDGDKDSGLTEETGAGDNVFVVTNELPSEDDSFIDLVWSDFSGTGGWENESGNSDSGNKVAVETFLPESPAAEIEVTADGEGWHPNMIFYSLGAAVTDESADPLVFQPTNSVESILQDSSGVDAEVQLTTGELDSAIVEVPEAAESVDADDDETSISFELSSLAADGAQFAYPSGDIGTDLFESLEELL